MAHHINKVMQKAGLGYNQEECFEILSAYERLYFIDEAHQEESEPISLEQKRKMYSRNVGDDETH